MSQWVHATSGYINLDHAVSAKRCPTGWAVFMVDGTDHVIPGQSNFAFYEQAASILPAQPGQECFLVAWDTDNRPTELWIRRMPILGWRILADQQMDPMPITPEALPSNGTVFTAYPDGKLSGGEDTYDSLEDMQTRLLLRLQEGWDTRHQPKTIA